jgi:hypothetical protein
MLRLAGREADGAVLALVAASDLPQLAAAVREGSGGRERELVLRLGVSASPDTERTRAHCRRVLAAYLNVPAYASMHVWLGREEPLAPLARACGAGGTVSR